MMVKTLKFGEVEVRDDAVLRFEEGMIGFAKFKSYALVESAPWEPFKWLQSLDELVLSFVVAEPKNFFPDYRPEPTAQAAADLKLERADAATWFVVVTLADPLTESTANLKGPIVANRSSGLARQIVLDDPRFLTKQRIFPV